MIEKAVMADELRICDLCNLIANLRRKATLTDGEKHQLETYQAALRRKLTPGD